MALPTNNFRGRLGEKDVNIYDIISKLDYRIQTTEERIEYIDKLVDDNDFFQIYNDQYYKVNVNKNDALCENINVFNFLDSMADYILFAPDKKDLDKNREEIDEDGNKVKVKPNKIIREYHKDARKNKRIVSLDALIDLYMVTGYCDNEEEAKQKAIELQDEIYAMNEAIRDDGSEKIIVNDKHDDYKRFPQLLQYKDINSELEKMKKNKKVNKKKLNRWISENRKDMILYKRSLEGTFRGKQAIHMFQPVITIENADYSDEEFILKHLPQICDTRFGMDSDLGVILSDIRDLVSESELTDMESQVLYLHAKELLSKAEIGRSLNVSNTRVKEILENISHKIVAANHLRYIDNYFINTRYGRYKKCNRCDDVKLTYFFDKDAKGKDGYRNQCKKCRK